MTVKPSEAFAFNESGALYSPRYDDCYRSREGAFAESMYVFCYGCGLPESALDKDELCIAETGFGAGFNFAATLTCLAERDHPLKLKYIAVEESPLPREMIRSAWQDEAPAEAVELFLPQWPEAPTPASGLIEARFRYGALNVELSVMVMTLAEAGSSLRLSVPADMWFLDGFAPAKNPGMWGDDLFAFVEANSAQECRFATFTAAGEVRRGLETLGFEAERRRGFGEKRHMSCGVRRG